MLPPVQLQVFTHGSASLRYFSVGEGKPLVLIHGLSGSAHWWRRNIPAFSRRYRVYVLDLAGYGQAWRQRSLGIGENAALVAAWLDFLDLRGVRLIGHSMGGHISMRVTEARPERISHLVLACASGLLTGQLPRLALRLPQASLTGRPSFVPRILLDSARAGFPNLWRSGSSVLRDNVTEFLPHLQVKTLVVWGARDALIPVALGRQLAASIPGAQYHEIARAGHVVMVDAPEEFNRVALEFLAQPARTEDRDNE